jgi:hypothetical protein
MKNCVETRNPQSNKDLGELEFKRMLRGTKEHPRRIPMKANVVLFGESNLGKTTALKILYLLLGGKKPGYLKKPTTYQYKRVVLKYNDLSIGFGFDGDTLEIVEENVEYFTNHYCDIAFSPTRIGGLTSMAMKYFIDKNITMASNCYINHVFWKKVSEIEENDRKLDLEPENLEDLLNVSLWEKQFPKSYALAEQFKKMLDDGCFD